MAEQKQISVKQYLANVESSLNGELTEHSAALPNDLNKQRFILNCISLVKDNANSFSGAAPEQVALVLAKGAYLGLDFMNKECYAICYGGNLQFQTDYKGEIKLCKKYSRNPIKDIYAKVVRAGDDFQESIVNGQQSVTFNPKPFNNGEIIGVFAVCMYQDGSMIYDTMSKEEVDATRKNYSKAPNSAAWNKSYGEMAKKTVLRRLCKLIDLDFDNIEQKKAFEDGGDSQFGGSKTIDVEATIINDTKEANSVPFVDAEVTPVEEVKEGETAKPDSKDAKAKNATRTDKEEPAKTQQGSTQNVSEEDMLDFMRG